MRITSSLTTANLPARATSPAGSTETPQDDFKATLPEGYRPTLLGKIAIGAGAAAAASGMMALVAAGAPAATTSGLLLAGFLAGTVGGVSTGVLLSLMANRQCERTGNAATAFMTPVSDREQAVFYAKPDPDREVFILP